jgi:hypothetical protein
MKKRLYALIIGAVIVTSLLMCSTAYAGVGSSIPVNGQHYNLNIIGKEKHGDVGDSNGHTMFVKEYGRTQIYMTQGDEFKVLDRNGLKGSAEFQIAPGFYDVYAVALGKPNKNVQIDAWGNFTDYTDVNGHVIIPLGSVDLTREKGKKPQSVDISYLFYVDVTVNNTLYQNYWVFAIPELNEYCWNYTNNGLKLLQVRFYENDTYVLPDPQPL